MTSLRSQPQTPSRLTYYDEKLDEILIEIQTCRTSFTKLELSVASITEDISIIQNHPPSDKDELKKLQLLIPSMQLEMTDFKTSFDNKLNGIA